jgi:hypothetical protein
MSYRNKTYVAFASEDIHYYRLMEAWRENEHIDFSFFDAHDLYLARDTSQPETIKRCPEARRVARSHPTGEVSVSDGPSRTACRGVASPVTACA